jgi:hypothetical protein
MKTLVTLGYVQVVTPAKDCDGMTRTIDFPRVGNRLYGSARYHWTVKQYLKEARNAALKALAK